MLIKKVCLILTLNFFFGGVVKAENESTFEFSHSILATPFYDPNAAFGSEFDFFGNTGVVSAPSSGTFFNPQQGEIYVLENEGSTWFRGVRLVPDDLEEYQNFGTAVQIAEDIIVAGSPNKTTRELSSCNDRGDGKVDVFVRDAEGWVHQQEIFSPDPSHWGFFGGAIALEGNRMMVGQIEAYSSQGFTARGGTGKVYEFLNENGNWTLVDTIVPQGGELYEEFGAKIALQGDQMAVLSAQAGDAGEVRLFLRSEIGWQQVRKIDIDARANITHWDDFGEALQFHGDQLFVSLNELDDDGQDVGGGAIFVYDASGVLVQEIEKPVRLSEGANFGSSITFQGKKMAVRSNNDTWICFFEYTEQTGTWNYCGGFDASDFGQGAIRYGGQSLFLGDDNADTSNGPSSGQLIVFSPVETQVPPHNLEITHLNGTISLSFLSQANEIYRIEWSDSLENDSWENFKTGISGTGERVFRNTSVEGFPKRYFRLTRN